MDESLKDTITERRKSEKYCPSALRAIKTTSYEQQTKLILTLPTGGEISEMENIRDHFKRLNFVVTIERLNYQYCVVTFESHNKAKGALQYQSQIGYKLEFLRDMELTTGYSQKHATDCRVLSPDTMISDQSFQEYFSGKTDDGELVTFSKCKGRKTIVNKRLDLLKSAALGWVSQESDVGSRLLQKIYGRD